MQHFMESLLRGHAFKLLMCLRAWHLEHWTKGGLSIHFLIVTSLPNSMALPIIRVLVMAPSGSKIAYVMEE